MEYDPDFARSFMQRTLNIATSYEGPHDATLLINCLLGLLIVPKEALFEKVPTSRFESLAEWGINPSSIKRFGRCEYGDEHKPNLRQLVRRLRNAVAHFKIDPLHEKGTVKGFAFRDRNGFHAEVSLPEIQSFVSKLSKHLAAQA
ncbi:MAG: hypothetical protein DME55_09095 [Verrucomicrobia bacterium]|nr:MAG: hypothetical protein DME55_09095 [Verrucomicrobiota bacterium]